MHTLSAFPQPRWIETVSCDGKPCKGGGGCGSSATPGGNCQSQACGGGGSCDMAAVLRHFAERHHSEVELRIADYSSLGAIQRSLEELNEILRVNGEDLRVSLDNIELVFSQIAPIIAFDDVLAFVGKAPGEEDLEDLLRLAAA